MLATCKQWQMTVLLYAHYFITEFTAFLSFSVCMSAISCCGSFSFGFAGCFRGVGPDLPAPSCLGHTAGQNGLPAEPAEQPALSLRHRPCDARPGVISVHYSLFYVCAVSLPHLSLPTSNPGGHSILLLATLGFFLANIYSISGPSRRPECSQQHTIRGRSGRPLVHVQSVFRRAAAVEHLHWGRGRHTALVTCPANRPSLFHGEENHLHCQTASGPDR